MGLLNTFEYFFVPLHFVICLQSDFALLNNEQLIICFIVDKLTWVGFNSTKECKLQIHERRTFEQLFLEQPIICCFVIDELTWVGLNSVEEGLASCK